MNTVIMRLFGTSDFPSVSCISMIWEKNVVFMCHDLVCPILFFSYFLFQYLLRYLAFVRFHKTLFNSINKFNWYFSSGYPDPDWMSDPCQLSFMIVSNYLFKHKLFQGVFWTYSHLLQGFSFFYCVILITKQW